MASSNSVSSNRLFIYTLLPTANELACCCLAAITIVFVEFSRYTGLQSTLSVIFHGNGVNMWSLQVFNTIRIVLLIVAAIVVLSVAMYLANRLRPRNHNAMGQFTQPPISGGATIRQSGIGPLERRLLWRAAVMLVILGFTIFILPLLYGRLLSGVDFYMASTANVVTHIAIIALVWILILHIYVVLARLLMMRVRLLGAFY